MKFGSENDRAGCKGLWNVPAGRLAWSLQDVKAGLDPHFVEDYSQVYDLALDYDGSSSGAEAQAGAQAQTA